MRSKRLYKEHLILQATKIERFDTKLRLCLDQGYGEGKGNGNGKGK